MLRLALEQGEAGGLPAAQLARVRQICKAHLASFQCALAAGVKIAAGTDCGNPYVFPGNNATELRYLVEAGLTPGQAIVSASGAAAELLGLGERLGTIAVGKWADLLLVDGDPSQNVGVLLQRSSIKLVLKGGVVQHGDLWIHSDGGLA
jgi:imidazolonepropionase-like amidohydrolase